MSNMKSYFEKTPEASLVECIFKKVAEVQFTALLKMNSTRDIFLGY